MSKETALEKFLEENRILDGEFRVADLPSFLRDYDLDLIGSGVQSRVYRIQGTSWVVKEGRWDFKLQPLRQLNLSIPSHIFEGVLSLFKMRFLPHKHEVVRQLALYSVMKSYLSGQRVLGDEEIYKIESYFKFKIRANIFDKLKESENSAYNYLPEEHTLYGPTTEEAYAGRETYYIFQRYVGGEHLHDIQIEKLNDTAQGRLYRLAILLMLMRVESSVVPDLRPRYLLGEVGNWFLNTDNILISNDDVKLIDTRLIWNLKDNFVKRGLILPDLSIGAIKQFLS